jgi:flagellar hook-length control protein FliK
VAASNVSSAGQSTGTGTSTARSVASVSEQVASATTARAQLVRRGGNTDFYLRLEPPELGTVHVHLQTSEGSVSARLVASSEAARAALESQLPDLRSRLGSAGVNVGGLDVSNGQAGSGQSSSGQGTDSPRAEVASAVAPARNTANSGPVYVPSASGLVNVIA